MIFLRQAVESMVINRQFQTWLTCKNFGNDVLSTPLESTLNQPQVSDLPLPGSGIDGNAYVVLGLPQL